MIREVRPADHKAITAIYNMYITDSTATFETCPVSDDEMVCRISGIASRYPCLVCEIDHAVVGYAYAHTWKEKAAYGQTWETTVYVSPRYQGKGMGKQLMERLVDECRKQGCHVLIACITAENEASIAFHRKLGFKQVSCFEKVGVKFGRRLDVVDYELLLEP